MRKKLITLCCSAIILTACSSSSSTPNPKIATSIFPVYDITSQVAGEYADVVLIVPPGASPHTFEPTPQNIAAIASSDILFYIGHGLDNWVTTIAQAADIKETVSVDTNIQLIPASHSHQDDDHPDDEYAEQESYDPHYWLSLSNARIITQTIADELSRIDPEHASEYQENATKYIQQISQVQNQQTTPALPLVTMHDAWRYFAQDNATSIVTTFEPEPGKEPDPAHIRSFIDTLKSQQITTIFTEPQLPQSQIQAISQDTGIAIKILDPLGGQPPHDSYLKLMQYNLDQIQP